MFNDQISFAIMLTVSLAFSAWYGRRHGKQYALGAGMAVSLLAGTWFEIEIFSTPINVTMATAIILLIVYCTHSWREIFKAINLLDVLITSLFLWHIVVDVYHDGTPLAVAAQAYGQWMLPYAAGRYAFLHSGSLQKLSPVFVTIAVITSLAAIYESFTSFNLWESLFIHVDDKVTRGGGLRYELLHRAIGPVRHPIFLGVVLFSMLPFAIDLASRAGATPWKRSLSFIAVLTIVLGILSTVSRGPALALGVAIAFALAWYSKPVRWALITSTVAAAVLVFVNYDTVLRYVDKTENLNQWGMVVNVDDADAPEVYTGTRNRIFVLKVYGPLFVKGGPLGYGTQASTGFPPRNLPGLPSDPRTRSRLGIVDNSYINVGLRLGWVGLAIFAGLLTSGILLALRLTTIAGTYFYPSDGRVMVAYASILFALIFEIATVFWSYDFAFWILFQIGVISALTSQVTRARQVDKVSPDL